MAWLRRWRLYVTLFMLILSFFLIHPFTRQGLMITNVVGPASLLLKPGDYLDTINGVKVNNLEDFDSINVSENDTVMLKAFRETFPYSYHELTHNYVADKNGLGISVIESSFSRLKLNYQIVGGYKITLKADDLERAKEVLEKRLAHSQVSDFSVKIENGNVVVYTTDKGSVLNLVKTKGEIEAKIGNETLFTSDDILYTCLSGVGCSRYLYSTYNETEYGKSIVWKYGFEVKTKDEVGYRFAKLTSNLSIAKCEMEVCILNEPLSYYLDGEYIGFENIYANYKGKNKTTFELSGIAQTREEAMKKIELLQAMTFGKLDAEVMHVEKIPAAFSEKAIVGIFITMFIIVIIGSLFLLIHVNNFKLIPVSLFVAFSELIIVLGIFAGLNLIIKLPTFFALLLIPMISVTYQNLFVRYLKKGEFSLKKSVELRKKVRYTMISLIIFFFFANFIIPSLATPLLIYLIVSLLLTKSFFINEVTKIIKKT